MKIETKYYAVPMKITTHKILGIIVHIKIEPITYVPQTKCDSVKINAIGK